MGGQQQGGLAGLFFPILLFIGIFYFLILRPQKKKQQQHDKMLSAISRGDTIITAGGFFGKVSDVLEDSYIIELADGVKVRILKSSISVRRDATDNAPRAPRPKKKDRPRRDRDASNGENKSEETAVAPEAIEEGVTSEETNALMDQATDAESTEKTVEAPTEETGKTENGN